MADATEKLRVAVVDHQPVLRDGVAAVVDRWGHGVVVLQAGDGLEYEARCAHVGHIHLALVDLCMPHRDGYDTLRWMARHQPRTKGIAIHHSTQPAEVRRALHCGARAVLNKSVTPADLVLAMEHVHRTGFHYNHLVSRALRRAAQAEADAHPNGADLWASLSPREQELLLLYTSPQVPTLADAARRMGITEGTAETHRGNLVTKLKVHSKTELVRLVLLHGWG